MASIVSCFSKFCLTLFLLVLFHGSTNAKLSTNFYSKSCPNLLPIVKFIVHSAIMKEARMGASLLRLFFHDCFVNGCDGSVLLDDTSSFIGEKNAAPNRNSARGFNVVDDIKSAVEIVCPGVFSCADILALSARDSVTILGGPYWDVKLGRRDARTASQAAANNNILSPSSNLNQLISRFSAHGLSPRDLVALSGHGYTTRATSTLHLLEQGKETVRGLTGSGDNNLAPLDIHTPTYFDNSYFKNLIDRRGLLHSDQQLFTGGGPTNSIVRGYINNLRSFRSDFAAAMIKMGDISPLTGTKGEIRKNCRRVN
ncbi:hypothetical protein GOBAR_DD22464 [Gossypium barbadense]|nr:hypothetical protein GOBAR_DD22464 [Gossypium barbadense]